MYNNNVKPKQFYVIINKHGDIIDFRDNTWKPRDVAPYIVMCWTGISFVEWQENDF